MDKKQIVLNRSTHKQKNHRRERTFSVHRHHHHRQVYRQVQRVIQHNRIHHHHQINRNQIEIHIIHRHQLIMTLV